MDEQNESRSPASAGEPGARPPLLSRGSMILRAVAGGYLLYIVWNLVRDFGQVQDTQRLLIGGVAVIFAAVAIWLLATTGKRFLRGEYRGGSGDPDRSAKK
ncbi:MAG: hypothetical protein Q4C60_02000 [Eubacteriales bacterium]|nr:hypothetical protein [Eubacteriales bacterium]